MKKKKKIVFKILLLVIIILVIIATVGPLLFSDTYLIQIIQTSFSEKTGLSVDIDDLEISPFDKAITLKGITVSKPVDSSKVATIDSAHISLKHQDIIDLAFSSKINIHDISMENIAISRIPPEYFKKFKHDSDSSNKKLIEILSKTKLNVSELVISRSGQDSFLYKTNVQITGDCNGGGIIEGEIVNFNPHNLNKMVVSAVGHNFIFNLESLNIKSIYTGELKLRNNFCDFTGILNLNLSPLKILNTKINTDYNVAGTFSFIENQLSFNHATITNTEGMNIEAKGSIKKPFNKNQRIIGAKIFKSLIPLRTLNIANSKTVIDFPQGFNFVGDVMLKGDLKRQDKFIDISGTASSESVLLSSPAENDNIIADVITELHVSSDTLSFHNSQASTPNINLNGDIYIPFSAFKHKNFTAAIREVDLDIGLSGEIFDLQKFAKPYRLFSDNITLKGNFNGSLSLDTQDDNSSNITISLKTENNFELSQKQQRSSSKLKKSTIYISAILTDKLDYNLKKVQVNSKALMLDSEIKGDTSSNEYSVKLDFDADLVSLQPFLPIAFAQKAQKFSRIKMETTAEFNKNENKLTTSKNKIELFFKDYTNPSSIILDGNIEIGTSQAFTFKIPAMNFSTVSTTDSAVTYKSSTARIQAQGDLRALNSANEYVYSPHGSLSAGLRSKNSAFINFMAKLLNIKKTHTQIAESEIRTRIKFNSDEINSLSQINSRNVQFGNPAVFVEKNLLSEISLKYDISSRKIITDKIKLTNQNNSYNVLISGSVYPDIMVFDNLHCKINADMAKLDEHFKGYAKSYQNYKGNVEIISELSGTAGTPSLTIVGKSDKISISENKFELPVLNPKFDAELEWDRDVQNKITDLKIKNIFITSNSGALFLSGGAERFKFDKAGYVSFGKGCSFDFAFKGNKNLLWMISPQLSSSIRNKGNEKSIEISGNLQAKKFPLFRFNKESEFDLLRNATINRGKFKIDNISAFNITAKDIEGDFTLAESKLTIANGKTDLSGKVEFKSKIDFSKEPKGSFSIKINKIDLANMLSYTPSSMPVLNGWLSLSQMNNKTEFAEFNWQGATLNDILQSLNCKRSNAVIADLIISTIVQKRDWEKILSEDFPPSIAKEIAKRIDKKLSQNYGKSQEINYKYFDTEYIVANKQIKLIKVKCGGGNTADFMAKGAIAFDGRIKLRVFPTANLYRSFDVNSILSSPSIEGILKNIPAEDRKNAYNILPQHLENLAQAKKLYIDISGTLENPVLNFDDIRKELRRNIPIIFTKFRRILKNKSLLNLFLGGTEKTLGDNPDAAKKINDITNMNLSDIIKMFD